MDIVPSKTKSDAEGATSSLFGCLMEDLPDPPREDPVEPNSFRNKLTKVLIYTALVPVLLLFFLLQQQFHSTIELNDANLTASAREVSILTASFLERFNDVSLQERLNQKPQSNELVNESPLLRAQGVVGFIQTDKKCHVTYITKSEDARLKGFDQVAENVCHSNKNPSSTGKVYIYPVSIGFKKHILVVKPLRDPNSFVLLLVDDAGLNERLRLIHTDESQHSIGVINEKNQWINRSRISELESHLLEKVDLNEILSKGVRKPVLELPDPSHHLDAVAIVPVEGTNLLAIAVQTADNRESILRSSFESIGLIVIGAFLATLVFGYMTAAPLTASLNELALSVELFSRTGQYKPGRIANSSESTREIAELAKSFGRMAQSVAQGRKELSQANSKLERLLKEKSEHLNERDRELENLQALLSLQENDQNVNQAVLLHFKKIFGLSRLEFIPADQPLPSDSDRLFIESKRADTLYGWISLAKTDASEGHRAALERLANLIAIVQANKDLLKQLQTEHATLASVFASVTDGIVIIGRSGRVLYANDESGRLLSSQSTIVGVPIVDVIRPWLGPSTELPEDWGKTDKTIQLEHQDPDGRNHVIGLVFFKASQLPGLTGDRLGIIIRDISHEAEVERIKDELLSVVAHELKTPITAISLMSESLSVKNPGDCETEELIAEIRNLAHLVDDLLDISRIDSGTMRLNPQVVHVASLIDRAARLVRARYPINIRRHIDESAETFSVDPERITQVFINLMNNAARYKKPSQDLALCDIQVKEDEDCVRIDITDFGIGIEQKHLSHVFERFYQADMSNTRRNGGSGLGLSIAQGIILAHGGRIKVTSTPGESTTFTIWLPY